MVQGSPKFAIEYRYLAAAIAMVSPPRPSRSAYSGRSSILSVYLPHRSFTGSALTQGTVPRLSAPFLFSRAYGAHACFIASSAYKMFVRPTVSLTQSGGPLRLVNLLP